MQVELMIDPSSLAEPICRFILAKAESLKCTPGEAVSEVLNELAAEAGFRLPAQSQPEVAR